jgi:hypothetical protein
MKAYSPHEGEWLASRPGRFTPVERAPGTHCIWCWAGRALETIRTMWNTEKFFPLPEIESWPSSPYTVSMPTEPLRLSVSWVLVYSVWYILVPWRDLTPHRRNPNACRDENNCFCSLVTVLYQSEVFNVKCISFCSLFYDSSSKSNYMVRNRWMTVNNRMEIKCKDTIMA